MVSFEHGDVGVGPVEIPPASELVVRHIKRAIHLGVFPPGKKLSTERELSESLGVSRSTLREALHQAKGEGYLEIRRGQRGGVFVRQPLADGSDLSRWLADQGDDLEAIFDFRIAVEGHAARRAASLIVDSQLEQLELDTQAMSSAESAGEFRKADLRFHLRIADCANSRLVRNAVEDARAALYLPFQPRSLDGMKGTSVPEHDAIIAALREGDADAAAAAMTDHIMQTKVALL